jgi:putative colanic acid biosynthesis UDP-glucose lipid carrier transferase
MSLETSVEVADRLAVAHATPTVAQLARESRDRQVIKALQQSSELLDKQTHAGARSAASTRESSGSAAPTPASSRLKRLIDVAGAGFGLVFLAPFLLLVALVIRLESPGPALFRQRRKGRGGVPFVIYKFRTMGCLEDGPDIQQAQERDCRATRFGAFLRRSSIDELPQLLNVLKGDMSLVGPRPHAVAHDEFYAGAVAGYETRFLTRPGISGLAQVSGLRGATPNVEMMAARIALDLEYIRRWSIGLDLRILWQTLLIGPFDPSAF